VAGAQVPNAPDAQLAPEDLSAPSTALPPGTVGVQVRDANERPVSGVDVRLMQSLFGHDDDPSKSVRQARTDADGKVSLTGLAGGRGVAYEVRVEAGRAVFTSGQFELAHDRGQEVTLHVYPATSDLAETELAMQALAYVVPRDDVFQWEFALTILNLGRVAWVTEDTRLGLPRGASAIESESRAPGLDWVPESGSARLVGTAGPGRHELVLRFQVKSQHDERASFHFDLPPRVAAAQVVAEGPSSLRLQVADAPPAELRSGPQGQSFWVVGWQAPREGPALSELAVTLSGIPTPGHGRWIALGAALLLAAWGAWPAPKRKPGTPALSAEDSRRAHAVVLDELVALERARRNDVVGPGTYEATRGKLLRALSELGQSQPRDKASPRHPKRWRQGQHRSSRKRAGPA
jgi:hypothetical protein